MFFLRAAALTCISLTFFTLIVGGQDDNLLDQGLNAFYSGEMAAAQRYVESYLRINSKDLSARVFLARVMAAQRNNKAAFSHLEDVLRQDPENTDALFYMASLTSAMSQSEYARLYNMAPNSTRVHQLMGESLVAQGKLEAAEQEFQASLKKSPGNAEVLVALGSLHLNLQRYESSADYFERALGNNPGNILAHNGLGRVHAVQGDHQKAFEHFSTSLQLAPTFVPSILGLGEALRNLAKPDEALKEFQKAIELDPNNDRAYFQMGQTYEVLGDQVKARDAYRKAQSIRLASQ